MTKLRDAVDETIENLEKIRDAQNPPDNEVLIRLDALYEQKIRLLEVHINEATDDYKKALKSLNSAAKSTKKAIKDLSRLQEALKKVATALDKMTRLLQAGPAVLHG
ncbi:hypothetical protein JW948_04865 [bacterium]|nr:hypothetical protein [bacterium]